MTTLLRDRQTAGTFSRLRAFLLLCAGLLAASGPALGQAPANDDFAKAAVLTGLPASATGSNAGATYETGEPGHINNGNSSVWWKWTAPAATAVVVDTKGSAFDTLLDVYVGDVITSLTVIAGNDDSGGSSASQVSFMAKAGTSYAFSVTSYLGNSGDVALNLAALAAPTITSQPQDATNYVGSRVELSVDAVGQVLNYTWFEGQAGDTNTPVAPGNSSSYYYFSPTPTTTTSYWVRVSNAAGFVDSRAAIVTVRLPDLPRIVSQPQDATKYLESDSSAEVSVEAVSQVLNYAWFEGQSGDTSTPVASGGQSYWFFAPSKTTSYWVRVSNAAGFVDSRSFTVTVKLPDPPVITAQPADLTNIIGLPSRLSVAASSQVLDYHWYEGVTGVTNVPISTASAPLVSLTADTQYWVRVSNASGFVDSRTMTVTRIPLKDALRISWNESFGKVESGTTVTRRLSLQALFYTDYTIRLVSIQAPSGFAFPSFGRFYIESSSESAFDISFSPTNNSEYAGKLTLVFDVPDTTIELPISGEGTAPSRLAEIDLDVAFGTVQVGRAATRNVTLRNVGASPIPLAGLSLPEGFQATLSQTNLAWGEELTIPVRFTPTASGDHSGTMQVQAELTSGSALTLAHGKGTAATGIVTVPTDQPTINFGIDAAGSGDTVRILPGTYRENVAIFKSVTLTSRYELDSNPAIAVSTILEGDGQEPVIAITGPAEVSLRGLTIRDGSVGVRVRSWNSGSASGPIGPGPGYPAATCRLTDSRVLHNLTGGIEIDADAYTGSFGFYYLSASAYAETFAVRNLFAQNQGPAVRLTSHGESGRFTRRGTAKVRLVDNVLHENAGGIEVDSTGSNCLSELLVNSVTLVNNGEFPLKVNGVNSHPSMVNSIVWDVGGYAIELATNVVFQVSHSLIGTGGKVWPGVGNIFQNPGFADLAGGNFALRADSPCVDAGIEQVPGRLDYSGTAPDMGALEQSSAEPRVASRRVGDNLEVYFNGILQSSAEVDAGFTDAAEQQNPLVVSPAEPVRFWRARSN